MNKLLMKKKLFILFTALCAVTANALFAQTTSVKGIVTAKSGTAVSGVTVVEINSNDRQVSGTNTDNDGSYNLRITNPANRLRFSHIGFTTKTESINGRSSINIRLEDDSARNDLENVVIITKRTDMVSNGFGTTSKRDLVGSVSTIKGDVFKDQPVTSIDQMIQGRAAGVQKGSRVHIRGKRSFIYSRWNTDYFYPVR
jgi:TonB-dependent starch-binding outer membrane protein SusC